VFFQQYLFYKGSKDFALADGAQAGKKVMKGVPLRPLQNLLKIAAAWNYCNRKLPNS